MGIAHSNNQTNAFNINYNITLDMSGWGKTTIQVVSPMTGVLFVYGSNDANALQGVRDGNASLAINFTPILATNLATGSTTGSISAAGNYEVDVNTQFLRLQGNPAATPTNVYKLILFNTKLL
jgi:hypothetical protein